MVRLKNQGKHPDISWEIWWMGLWSYAEITLAIIVACALSLPRLFRAKSKEFGVFISVVLHPLTSLKSFRTDTAGSTIDAEYASDIALQEVHEKVGIRKTIDILQGPAQPKMSSEEGFQIFMARPASTPLRDNRIV